MLSKNLTVAATDSVTVLTDTTVTMNIAQSIHNNGRISINSSSADVYTFGSSVTTSGLLQAFRGGSTPDNIVQVIYTVSELQAAGMLPNDLIDSIYLSFILEEVQQPIKTLLFHMLSFLLLKTSSYLMIHY